jgi:hypothetical protein
VFNALKGELKEDGALKGKLKKHKGHITRKLIEAEGGTLGFIDQAKEIGFKIAKNLNRLAGKDNNSRKDLDKQLDTKFKSGNSLKEVRTTSRKNKTDKGGR